MANDMGWKWSKDPKPEQLAKLTSAVRNEGLKSLKKHGPQIANMIRNRIRHKHMIARADGTPRPIPGYSKGYTARLRKYGRSTAPDYTSSGNLLDHLRGRIRVIDSSSLELRIAPYGRSSSGGTTTRQKGKKGRKGTSREGYWYRQPYTYSDHRSGATVQVAGQWIKLSPDAEKTKKYTKRKVTYNAHLATYLSQRLGGGRWASGGNPTPFITLNRKELDLVRKILRGERKKPTRAVLKKVAGK